MRSLAALVALSFVAACAPPTATPATPTTQVPIAAQPQTSTASSPALPPPKPTTGAVKLAAAPGHTCALLASGRVACWGGSLGPLVSSMYTPLMRPTLIAGVTDAIDVATGVYHSCAVRRAGDVVCWGQNSDGELGDPKNRYVSFDGRVVTVPGIADAVEIASRGMHTCVRRRDGRVTCWGKNDTGQVSPNPSDASAPVDAAGITDAVEIATSHTQSCVRHATGAVTCWGDPIPRGKTRAPPWEFPGIRDAVRITADARVCVVRANGQVVCAGSMAASVIMPSTQAPPPSVTIAGIDDAVDIAEGGSFECAVRRSGHVACWGENHSGELGDGAAADHAEPGPVAGLDDAVQVAATWNSICARRRDGNVSCWGANNEAQLGLGTTDIEPVPVRVADLDARVLAAGGEQTCALTDRGVVCWGLDPTTMPNLPVVAPTAVAGVPPNANAIAVGRWHGCALADGAAWCWGDPSALGATLPYRDERAPRQIAGVTNAIAIAAGEKHQCALERGGRVTCWGQNENGQLGDGTTRPRLDAAFVKGLTDATAITAGGSHTCALRKGGAVACWGTNGGGQLGVTSGNGDLAGDQTTPAAPTGLRHDIVSIAAGDLHTCAVHAHGTVTCWGVRHQGHLICANPGGCHGQRHIDVSGITDAKAVWAGGERTCALRSGGRMTCWTHADAEGVDATDVPVANATAAAIGETHACVLDASKHAWCWGRNISGQVGAPLPLRRVPTPILLPRDP